MVVSGLFACLFPQPPHPILHEIAGDTSQESHMHPALVCEEKQGAHRIFKTVSRIGRIVLFCSVVLFSCCWAPF